MIRRNPCVSTQRLESRQVALMDDSFWQSFDGRSRTRTASKAKVRVLFSFRAMKQRFDLAGVLAVL